jgi:hypothetical protein
MGLNVRDMFRVIEKQNICCPHTSKLAIAQFCYDARKIGIFYPAL